jgi:2-iminoacetate synthase ThiH
VGEPYGLDTVRFTALCRLELPAVPHVIADVEALGPRLAQMCFGFGADELHAHVMNERALRLGDNANATVLTPKEAVTLIRGAGLIPAERQADDALEEIA